MVIGNKSEEFADAISSGKLDGKIVWDIVRVVEDLDEKPPYYEGIAW